MFGIILRRCLASLPLLFCLSVVAFSIIKLIPGDPVEVLLGAAEKDVAPSQVQAMRKELGLDQPVTKQYASWLTNIVLHGEFGRSYRDGRPAILVIGERLPATFVLVGAALVISFSLGIAWGMAMVWLASQNSKLVRSFDSILAGAAVVFYSAPSFWVGFLVIAAVSQYSFLSSLPLLSLHEPGQSITAGSFLQHALLPALVLASRRTAKVALFVRSSTLDESDKGYVVVARSKGLSVFRVLTRHVMRNSLLPIVTLFALSLPALLGGSVLVETVFGWPGMGRLAVDATFARNYPILLALTMIYGTLVIISNLIADIIQLCLDPRARESLLSPASYVRGSG